ncbi:A/G-specific adenine glycosylase [Microvirga sp. W0021]|uniref:Adenine DNA glycosylase n=1 Tax=Hohaiivirga grylli TaxID=3133970 RepID=A0ABV0BJQ9_9HYPH
MISARQPDSSDLLQWYDRHQRVLPWRARLGEIPDPYRVWLSEIMLQQTTVVAVKPYFEKFVTRFPDVFALADAPSEEVMQAWAGLGYYSRARNLHACAKQVAYEFGGVFPDNEAELLKLPGIGPYTAGAITSIAFNKPAVAVDGNVERVMTRLFALTDPLPGVKGQVREKALSLLPEGRSGDFAQALMDLGATICSPKKPACSICPWMELCLGRRQGIAETLPVKAPKQVRPTRLGAIFVIERKDGAILVETRPPSGLLGGMAAFPSSQWAEDYDLSKAMLDAPMELRWKRLMGEVKHVFTHFQLLLTVYVGRAALDAEAPEGMRWVPRKHIDDEALPSVMRKVLSHAISQI